MTHYGFATEDQAKIAEYAIAQFRAKYAEAEEGFERAANGDLLPKRAGRTRQSPIGKWATPTFDEGLNLWIIPSPERAPWFAKTLLARPADIATGFGRAEADAEKAEALAVANAEGGNITVSSYTPRRERRMPMRAWIKAGLTALGVPPQRVTPTPTPD